MSVRDYAVVWRPTEDGRFIGAVYRYLDQGATPRFLTEPQSTWEDAIAAGKQWAATHKPKKKRR